MAKWSRESVLARLDGAGLQVLMEKPIDNAMQLTLLEGTVICLYTTGKLVVQGKKNEERSAAEKLFAGTPPKAQGSTAVPRPANAQLPSANESIAEYPAQNAANQLNKVVPESKSVFIVYGHDKASRDSLELMLLRIGLQPVILANMVPNGNTVIEALIEHSEVRCAIVLLTPDDEGHPTNVVAKKRFRARQNVVLEMGMFLSKLGRSKVIILHKGDLELPSDINGLIYLPYKTDVQEVKSKLAGSLQKIGFNIDIEKLSAE
jgi:predicted nucleotide-binding protein